MTPSTTSSVAILTLGVLLVLVLAGCQSAMSAGLGSDHPVHRFLVRAVRKNERRLFLQIPGLLNRTLCGALPIYMHWVLSWFSPSGLRWAERLLNPLVSALHVLLVAGIALVATKSDGVEDINSALTACAFGLTPQFYHSFSARNFGLSARSIGLLFLTVFFACAQSTISDGGLDWLSLIGSSWLVWGFSTFATQSMVLFSLVLILIAGTVVPLVAVAAGAALFVLVHPAYARSYLRSTLDFIITYAKQIAPIYILQQRYSIWRDLVWDAWCAFRQGPSSGVRYAYDNSILVVLLLNPLVCIGCWDFLWGGMRSGGIRGFAGAISAASVAVVVLTSFRRTRFLGEPERYAEAAAPWGALAAIPAIADSLGTASVVWILVLFLVVDLAQVTLSGFVARRLRANQSSLDKLTAAIDGLRIDVRLCSNNEQITKRLMLHDWKFACCISASDDYCGLSFSEAFPRYPMLRRKSMERIVAECRVNVCVFDRSLFDTIFNETPSGLLAMETVYESAGFRVTILKWAGDCPDPGEGHGLRP